MAHLKFLKWINVVMCSAFVVMACHESNDEIPTPKPDPDPTPNPIEVTLASPAYDDLSTNAVTLSAVLSGDVDSVSTKGFCMATHAGVSIADSTVEDKNAGSNVTVLLLNLEPGTAYYAKAFVITTDEQIVYSAEILFTTLDIVEEDLLGKYEAPTYPDDYTDISAWSNRYQWNLANVHDPTVVKAEDGYYYMYQTDASYGNVHKGQGHFHARRSKDLVNWEYLGATMKNTPLWVKAKLNEMRTALGLPVINVPGYGYWAPVVRKAAPGKYRMYYCIVVDNYIATGKANTSDNFDKSWTERAFIGMMETSDPAGNVWEDKGYVVCSSTDRGKNWSRSSLNDWNAYFKWNAIDPSYIISNSGEHWLIYGSWHSGIVALQLNPETGMPLNELGNPWEATALPHYGVLIATRNSASRWQGSEAPEIIYNPETGYYYLFMACDELSVAYNTRVCRSKNITGPYVGIDGTNVSAGGEMYPVVTHPYKFNNSHGWVGISHCAVFDDGQGNWFYSSQGRLPADVPGINASNAVMMGQIRNIRWTTDGWPVVMPERYGAVPQVPIEENELIGDWEHIDLGYSYRKQKTPAAMTLGADHKITAGMWKGASWSYDSVSQILTANKVELCLQREVDWEASPRTHTIVYAGYNNKKTYWGKKIKL